MIAGRQVFVIDVDDRGTPKLKALGNAAAVMGDDVRRGADALDRIEESLRRTKRSGDGASKAFKEQGLSLLKLDAGINVALRGYQALRGVIGQFKEPVSIAIDTQSGINALRTLSDNVTGDLRQQLLKLPAEIGQSTRQVLSSAYDALSAGISEGQVVQFLRSAGQLAKAGQADLVDTAKALQASFEAFGASGQTIESVNDILFETARVGKTTLRELAPAFPEVATAAAQYGVSLEQATAATAALTKTAPSTSQAVTQLAALINAFAKPSGQAAKKMEALGIQYGIGTLRAKGLTGVLDDVFRATNGNVEVFGDLFQRKEANNALLSLLARNQENYRGALERTSNATGSVAKGVAIMNEGAQGTLNRFNALKEQAFREIGERLLPRFVEGLEALTEWFREDGDKFIDDVTDGLKAVGEALVVVSKLAVVSAKAIGSIARGTQESLANLRRGLDATRDAAISLNDRFPLIARSARASIPAVQEAEAAQHRLKLAMAAMQAQLEAIDASRMREIAEHTTKAIPPVNALSGAVTALTSTMGGASIAASAVASEVLGVGVEAGNAYEPVLRFGRMMATLAAQLTAVPGAAVATSAAFDELASRARLPKAESGTAPAARTRKPLAGGNADTARDRARFTAELELASIADENARKLAQLEQDRLVALGRARELGVDRSLVQDAFDQRLIEALTEMDRRTTEASEALRRATQDDRVRAIADDGERELAALDLRHAREREAVLEQGRDVNDILIAQARERSDALAEQARDEFSREQERRRARVELITDETTQRLELLDIERDEKLARISETGLAATEITAFYETERTRIVREQADARLARLKAEVATTASLVGNIAALGKALGVAARQQAILDNAAEGARLLGKARAAGKEALIEGARGNVLKAAALGIASAAAGVEAIKLGANLLGGGGSPSPAAVTPPTEAPRQVRSASPQAGGSRDQAPIVFNVGTVIGEGGMDELGRRVAPAVRNHNAATSGYIGEAP